VDPLVGKTLNRYRILNLLGEGGMGAVYKANDVTLQRDVAIKVMHPHFARQSDFQDRFLQEARTTAHLDHPGIVQVYDFGQDRSYLYIVMKFIAGDNLEMMLRGMQTQNKWIVLTEAIKVIRQVALALDYAHRQGVLHRDIKPANIMLEPEPFEGLPYRVVITDLGLAKLAQGGVMTQEGASMGTPAYMSPEQALGKPTDGRSDVYSLGVLLFELTTGRLPFPAKSLSEAILYHVQTPPPLPRSIRPDLPEELEQIILRTLEKEPAKRYPTAAALAEALLAAAPAATKVAEAPSMLEGAVSLFTQYQNSLVQPRGASILEEFEPVPETSQDRIQIMGQDKTTRAVQIKRTALIVGRDPHDDIVLDDQKVSRQHARIEFDGTNYRVTDLNSTNGTFLENVRLLPGIPGIWTPDKALRIGDNWLRLLLPQGPTAAIPTTAVAAAAARAGAQIDNSRVYTSPGQGRVGIFVDTLQVTTEPGQSITIPILLLNRGAIADLFSVSVTGIPAPWITVPTAPIRMMPGDQKPTSITIHPPRVPQSRAGRYSVSISISCQASPNEVAETRLALTISVYSQFTSELSPTRLRAGEVGRLTVKNLGNAQESYHLGWKDRSNELAFTPAQLQVNVPEGQEIAAEYRTDLRQQRWVGGEKLYLFTAQVNPSTGQPQTHSGEVLSRGMVPVWVFPVLGSLCVILLIMITLFSTIIFGGANRATQAVNASQTGLEVAALQTNQSGTSTGQALANANQTTQTAATQAAMLTNTQIAALFQTATVQQLSIQQTSAAQQAASQTAAEQTGAASIQTSVAQTANALATQQFAGQLTVAAQQTLAAGVAAGQTAAAQTAIAAIETSAARTANAVATARMAATLTAAASQKPIAYVYSSDLTTANDFKSMLESRGGFSVDLIPQSNVLPTNFGLYKAVIIGHETGSLGDWGDAGGAQANHIASASRPILGLGEGGYAFFGKLSLTIGFGNGAHGNGTDIYVVNTSEPFWSTPNSISIPGSQIITLYNSGSSYVAIYIPSPVMGIDLIGSENSSANHYQLIQQVGPFFLWGFEDGPGAMNNKGQRLFLNIMEYLTP